MGSGYLTKKLIQNLREDYKRSREEVLDFADELQRAWDRMSYLVRQISAELQEVVKFLEEQGYVRIVNRPEYQAAQAARQGAQPGPTVSAGEPTPSEPQPEAEANQ